VLRTRYRSDALQRCYFVIDGLDALMTRLADMDFDGAYGDVEEVSDLEPA